MQMKAAIMLTAVFALASVSLAQNQGQASPPANAAAADAAQSSGRAPVQTKTNEEYQAYQAAIANASNAPAMEKAADDFAAKFPDSNVRVLLYRAAMSSYQSTGNSQKMMDVGQ